MTEGIHSSAKVPGIVIFVAVLNFIGSSFLFLFSAICLVLLVFGNAVGFYETVTKQITQVYGQYNFSLGMNLLFGVMLMVGLFFALLNLLIGLGLLKGKKLAWYFQVAFSALGLVGFPIGTAINVVILIFFFQQSTRDYFKV